ncbi:MAG: integrase [Alteromonadaceae bacterium]|nr:integrase [Alteromonadaceae bacterium]
MINQARRYDGRSTDLYLKWLTHTYGDEWEEWRLLAAEWLSVQDTGINTKLLALTHFFETYLIGFIPYSSSICAFFEGVYGQSHRCSSEEYKNVLLKNTDRRDNASLARLINAVTDFLDWVLRTHFSELNNNGHLISVWNNPFQKVKYKGKHSETVYNPLPYRYILNLRHILCPKLRGHFSDWIWAQKQTGQGTKHGDWFKVDRSIIDKTDPDCVWREKVVNSSNKQVTLYQIWSPVKAMMIYIKLHLPLRSYQVRMLDSGEADTWRYDHGQWKLNDKAAFALGNEKHPFSKGVFRRHVDHVFRNESTGLYISTNKTADQNKDELDRGYEIPWQNEDVLYWLEKLRNWQEKYNPITQPTDCTTLKKKHTAHQKSKAYLSAMGHICFLFRDASAKSPADKIKPIAEGSYQKLWYKLLVQLEEKLKASGVTLSNGELLKLVHDYGENYTDPKAKTEFPLHSLRVSLITCYAMDANVPIPVISKLLAGHSRLLMTIYYTKLTPAVMQAKMDEAHQQLEQKSEESLRTFLKDASMRQIQCKTVYHDDNAIEAVLVNRNPIGWEYRHHGLCLVGGNTVRSNENGSISGCWNGGEMIKDGKNAKHRVYSSVPHGPENCIRCRWFISDARYLPALNAHLNLMSYKASEVANLAVGIEREISALEEEKYIVEIKSKPFTKHSELQALHRRYEKQMVEADEYTKDWIATFKLIKRIIEIEQDRADDETNNKLVAVGSHEDINIGFMETSSELLQLSLICDDAEFYPDLLDEVMKTPAIERRTQKLCHFMMRKGYMPHLLMMDKEQQLIAANAMMRQMAEMTDHKNKLEGYRKVTNYLEMGKFLEDESLLEQGIKAMNEKSKHPVLKLNDGLLRNVNNDGGLVYAD